MTSADRNLDHLYPLFHAKVLAIMDAWDFWAFHNDDAAKRKLTQYRLEVIEGFRTAEYQHGLYEKGRTKPGDIVTQRDGISHPSNHQSGLAADLVPVHIVTGAVYWKAPKLAWDWLGHCARAQGLESGGDWTGFQDLPHVEWDEHDKATYAKAHEWLKVQGLR